MGRILLQLCESLLVCKAGSRYEPGFFFGTNARDAYRNVPSVISQRNVRPGSCRDASVRPAERFAQFAQFAPFAFQTVGVVPMAVAASDDALLLSQRHRRTHRRRARGGKIARHQRHAAESAHNDNERHRISPADSEHDTRQAVAPHPARARDPTRWTVRSHASVRAAPSPRCREMWIPARAECRTRASVARH